MEPVQPERKSAKSRGQWLRDRGRGGRRRWRLRMRDAQGVKVGVGGNRAVWYMDIRHVVNVCVRPVTRSSIWCKVE